MRNLLMRSMAWMLIAATALVLFGLDRISMILLATRASSIRVTAS